ncbi:MAG: hypothetical protein H7831_11770, partial [Magnetococcus sp. WYHC-3]
MTRHVSQMALLVWLGVGSAWAGPFAPAAGQSGSDALSMDDADIAAWAHAVVDYQPGASVSLGFQTPEKALGRAAGTAYDVVSLGCGGSLTLAFDPPLGDGPGWDLAVFENGFRDDFLELAFVEISSDGSRFYRFPGTSLTPAAVAGFGSVDPTDVDGLAGKYRQGFGTPFDFQTLAGHAGLDLESVTHVRLVDIVGNGSALDQGGRPIYDPFPTVTSAGFDVDAMAGRYPVQLLSGNHPPLAPQPVTPEPEATQQSAQTRLALGAFQDPDIGDSHRATRWQVGTQSDFSPPLLDLESETALTTLTLPPLLLQGAGRYVWRAQVLDAAGAASPWSVPRSYTVAADGDANGDGVNDAQAVPLAMTVDLDRDGVDDHT